MDEQKKYLQLQYLTVQLAQHLECLRDALTDLSLSLKDNAIQQNPELARSAAELAAKALQRCAHLTPEPPTSDERR